MILHILSLFYIKIERCNVSLSHSYHLYAMNLILIAKCSNSDFTSSQYLSSELLKNVSPLLSNGHGLEHEITGGLVLVLSATGGHKLTNEYLLLQESPSISESKLICTKCVCMCNKQLFIILPELCTYSLVFQIMI